MVKLSLCLKAMQLMFMGCMQVVHIPVQTSAFDRGEWSASGCST